MELKKSVFECWVFFSVLAIGVIWYIVSMLYICDQDTSLYQGAYEQFHIWHHGFYMVETQANKIS